MEVTGESTKAIEPLVAYTVKGSAEGEYLIEFQTEAETFSKNLVVSNSVGYSDQIKKINGNGLNLIRINYDKRIVMNLFGWKVGWLGTYIMFSIAFSLILRRLMKVH